MASKWCVKPEDVKIDLAWKGEGFWIRIRRRLTTGEKRRTETGGWRSVSTQRQQDGKRDKDASPEINIDWRLQGLVRALTYLLDWSLADDDTDKKLPLTMDALESLDPEVFDLIENAITAHVEAMDEEKKTQNGAGRPSPTSA